MIAFAPNLPVTGGPYGSPLRPVMSSDGGMSWSAPNPQQLIVPTMFLNAKAVPSPSATATSSAPPTQSASPTITPNGVQRILSNTQGLSNLYSSGTSPLTTSFMAGVVFTLSGNADVAFSSATFGFQADSASVGSLCTADIRLYASPSNATPFILDRQDAPFGRVLSSFTGTSMVSLTSVDLTGLVARASVSRTWILAFASADNSPAFKFSLQFNGLMPSSPRTDVIPAVVGSIFNSYGNFFRVIGFGSIALDVFGKPMPVVPVSVTPTPSRFASASQSAYPSPVAPSVVPPLPTPDPFSSPTKVIVDNSFQGASSGSFAVPAFGRQSGFSFVIPAISPATVRLAGVAFWPMLDAPALGTTTWEVSVWQVGADGRVGSLYWRQQSDYTLTQNFDAGYSAAKDVPLTLYSDCILNPAISLRWALTMRSLTPNAWITGPFTNQAVKGGPLGSFAGAVVSTDNGQSWSYPDIATSFVPMLYLQGTVYTLPASVSASFSTTPTQTRFPSPFSTPSSSMAAPSPSSMAVPSPSSMATPSPSSMPLPSMSPTAPASPSSSVSFSQTPTGSTSFSGTVSRSFSASSWSTASLSASASATSSLTMTATGSGTVGASPSSSSTIVPSQTPTPTNSMTAEPSTSSTATNTMSVTISETSTITETGTSAATPSSSPSADASSSPAAPSPRPMVVVTFSVRFAGLTPSMLPDASPAWINLIAGIKSDAANMIGMKLSLASLSPADMTVKLTWIFSRRRAMMEQTKERNLQGGSVLQAEVSFMTRETTQTQFWPAMISSALSNDAAVAASFPVAMMVLSAAASSAGGNPASVNGALAGNPAVAPAALPSTMPSSNPVGPGNNNNNPAAADSGPNVGAIVGGILGGLAFVGVVAALFVFWRKRKSQNSVINSRAARKTAQMSAKTVNAGLKAGRKTVLNTTMRKIGLPVATLNPLSRPGAAARAHHLSTSPPVRADDGSQDEEEAQSGIIMSPLSTAGVSSPGSPAPLLGRSSMVVNNPSRRSLRTEGTSSRADRVRLSLAPTAMAMTGPLVAVVPTVPTAVPTASASVSARPATGHVDDINDDDFRE